MSSDHATSMTGQSGATSVGVLLSNERIKRGISIQQAADYLKLSRSQIEALEADDFDRLPGATFVRGFVRNYAKYLELDPAYLMTLMDEHVPSVVQNANAAAMAAQQAEVEAEADTPASLSSASASMNSTESSKMSGKWWILVLLALAGGAYFAMGDLPSFSDTQRQPEQVQETEQAETVVESNETQHNEASAPVEGSEDSATDSNSENTTPSAENTAQNATQNASDSAITNVPEGMEVLKISPRQDSWMEVRDARGERLIYGIQTSGRTREVAGKPPFKLTIGNATEVDVIYKNEVVSLKPYVKRGTTARLELK